MTVAEMIEELEKFNPELIVSIQNDSIGRDTPSTREVLFVKEKHYINAPPDVIIS